MDVVKSVNGVPIRLTDERWDHIVQRHADLQLEHSAILRIVESPDAVIEGSEGESLAVRRVGGEWIVVAYREVDDADGFIITTFVSERDPSVGRTVLWPLA